MSATDEVGGGIAATFGALNEVCEIGHAIHAEIAGLAIEHPHVNFSRLREHAERLVSTMPGVPVDVPQAAAEPQQEPLPA